MSAATEYFGVYANDATSTVRRGLPPLSYAEIVKLAIDGYWTIADGRMHEFGPVECWQALAADAQAECDRATRYLLSGPWLVQADRDVFARNAETLRRIANYARVQTESPGVDS